MYFYSGKLLGEKIFVDRSILQRKFSQNVELIA